MQASVYKAQTHNQSSYFVKLKQSHSHDTSPIIIELLRNAGIQQIIPIVKTIHGQETQHVDDFTLTVSPFVQGQDGFSRDLTNDQWYTLGKAMRQIHGIDVPAAIQAKIRRESYSPKWREAVRSLYPLMESEPRGDRVAVNLLTFMKKNITAIHRLVDRAEQLAQRVQDQSPPFVLCHSDLHGGNVVIPFLENKHPSDLRSFGDFDKSFSPKYPDIPGLKTLSNSLKIPWPFEHLFSRNGIIDENDALYIVDWDDPIMAPKERDLMFIGGGVANVWNKPHEKELFYKGYGKPEINTPLLAYYRHERIVEDIAIYGQQLLLTTAGGSNRINWYKDFIAQFDPQGVVEIAFKTDEELTIMRGWGV